ncbi:DUF805 domain-containing protein [Hyphomonas sp. FCG-A18]|uniref:DUF805 domain-containing protein n=1 Tax=Hyphomonas sp. FCG-A18 TaxID=3080019 RepID=UPI002B28DFEF|nr:DUF805 domain-containing protein [Hyphomonas sp. FCG-A18]
MSNPETAPHGSLNFGQVLFSPKGRITQGQFWGGWAALFIANIVVGFIPVAGNFLSIALIYVGACIYGKRLHDMGKSGWVHLVPWVVTLIIGIGVTVQNYDAVVAFMELAESGREPTEEEALALFSELGPFFFAIVINLLIWLVYTIWVGASDSEKFDNRHGSGPVGDAF